MTPKSRRTERETCPTTQWMCPRLSGIGVVFLLLFSSELVSANPVVWSNPATIYATVTDPFEIEFDSQGYLYSGRNRNSYVYMYRIAPGGGAATAWGSLQIVDPDGIGVHGDYVYAAGKYDVFRTYRDTGVTEIWADMTDARNMTSLTIDQAGSFANPGDVIIGNASYSNYPLDIEVFDAQTRVPRTLVDSSLVHGPRGLQVVDDSLYFVANADLWQTDVSGSISRVDVGSFEWGSPKAMVYSNADNSLYIGDDARGEIVRYSVSTGATDIIATGFADISGLAFDPEGNLYVADQEADVIWKSTRSPRVHAVIVGCATTVHHEVFGHPVYDTTFYGDHEALRLKDTLEANLEPSQLGRIVPVLIDNDEEDNLERVLAAIHTVADDVRPGDAFMFFETGHGWSGGTANETLDEDQGVNPQDEHLVLSRTPELARERLSDNDLAAAIGAEPNLLAANKLVILTGCFTGGFWGGGDGDLDTLPRLALLAGATEDKYAQWFSYFDLYGSPVGSNLIEAFTKIGGGPCAEYLKADDDFDGQLTIAELLSFMDSVRFSAPEGAEWRLLNGLDELAELSYEPSLVFSPDLDLQAAIVVPIPEPSTLALLSMAALALTIGWWRRRR